MQHADTALPGHRDGHPGLGDGVHRTGDQRDLHRDVAGQLGGGVGFARNQVRSVGQQQHVVVGQPDQRELRGKTVPGIVGSVSGSMGSGCLSLATRNRVDRAKGVAAAGPIVVTARACRTGASAVGHLGRGQPAGVDLDRSRCGSARQFPRCRRRHAPLPAWPVAVVVTADSVVVGHWSGRLLPPRRWSSVEVGSGLASVLTGGSSAVVVSGEVCCWVGSDSAGERRSTAVDGHGWSWGRRRTSASARFPERASPTGGGTGRRREVGSTGAGAGRRVTGLDVVLTA